MKDAELSMVIFFIESDFVILTLRNMEFLYRFRPKGSREIVSRLVKNESLTNHIRR